MGSEHEAQKGQNEGEKMSGEKGEEKKKGERSEAGSSCRCTNTVTLRGFEKTEMGELSKLAKMIFCVLCGENSPSSSMLHLIFLYFTCESARICGRRYRPPLV